MNANQIDSQLDGVVISQLIWKSDACKKIAVRICQTACSCADSFFPEDIRHDDLAAEDVNCIGSVFRYLAGKKAGKIISRTGTFRRSKADGAHGRTVFAYVLTSRALAESLVKRYGASVQNPQTELFKT